LRWKRIDDSKFQAEPTLLNPGDQVATYVYVSNVQSSVKGVKSDSDNPIIHWGARVVNLQEFTKPESWIDKNVRERWGINVELYGWSFWFTIGCFIVFQALYLRLLVRTKMISAINELSIGLILVAGLLSLAAGDSMATYLFGNTMTHMTGVDFWMNGPPIVLNALALAALYLRVRSTESKPA
jgi:hypothetical protein